MRTLLLIFLLSLSFGAGSFCFGQKDTVYLQVKDESKSTVTADYFLAGTINGWNPADTQYRFTRPGEGNPVLKIICDRRTLLQYKLTRGNWGNVECNEDGTDVSNRVLRSDTAKHIFLQVKAWRNPRNIAMMVSSASSHVQIMDTAFYIPQLGRKRRIWLYLPANYTTSRIHYPVLYMQDGQNLFDKITAPFGEWGVDECLDTLPAKGTPPCIVVGVDNGGATRMSEYNPYPFTMTDSINSVHFSGEGDAYLSFLVNTLKPYIDTHYRTLPSRENTMIAGSSMGGLISYYAMLRYPGIFGKAGIFSPAFWTAPDIGKFTDSAAAKLSSEAVFFFYAGVKEYEGYEDDMQSIADRLAKLTSAKIYLVEDRKGVHNESYWRKWFPEFYRWVWNNGKTMDITSGQE